MRKRIALPTFELFGHIFQLQRTKDRAWFGGYEVYWQGHRVVGPGPHMLGGSAEACANVYKWRIAKRFPSAEALNKVLGEYVKR